MQATQLFLTFSIAFSVFSLPQVVLSQEDSVEHASQPCKSDRPPAAPPDQALRELIRQLHNPDGLPVHLRPQTDPIYYFDSLPDVDFRRGKQRSNEYYSRHVTTQMDKGLFDEELGVALVYNESDCENSRHGLWIQFSPLVCHPDGSGIGFFVRTTPGPCLPLGGTIYWATVHQTTGNLKQLLDLRVIEF